MIDNIDQYCEDEEHDIDSAILVIGDEHYDEIPWWMVGCVDLEYDVEENENRGVKLLMNFVERSDMRKEI